MKKLCVMLLLSVAAHACTARAATTLYDETFDSPSSPTYETAFGNLEVASPTPLFATNSLRFNSQGNPGSFYYDQIQFRVDYVNSPYLGIPHEQVTVDFDVYTQELIGTPNHFAILLDTPGASALRFRGTGEIAVQNWGTSVRSHFSDLAPMHVRMILDLEHQKLSIAINGNPIYSGQSFPERLRSVRFSLGAESADVGDETSAAYVDNIRIVAFVPEPAAAALVVPVIGAMECLRRKSQAPRNCRNPARTCRPRCQGGLTLLTRRRV